jgi:hypothetical protein
MSFLLNWRHVKGPFIALRTLRKVTFYISVKKKFLEDLCPIRNCQWSMSSEVSMSRYKFVNKGYSITSIKGQVYYCDNVLLRVDSSMLDASSNSIITIIRFPQTWISINNLLSAISRLKVTTMRSPGNSLNSASYIFQFKSIGIWSDLMI